MTTMYFASNQSKQKAFDRYYNAKAKSDFKQGVKLKALINKEAADAALAEQLASMYMQAVGKTREYDYDTVNDKLGRKAPPVVKEKNSSSVKVNIKKGKKQPKRVYVHQSTDTKKSVSEGPSGIEDEYEEKAPIPPDYVPMTPDGSPRRKISEELKDLYASVNTQDYTKTVAAEIGDEFRRGSEKKKRKIKQRVMRGAKDYIARYKKSQKKAIRLTREEIRTAQSDLTENIIDLISPPSSPRPAAAAPTTAFPPSPVRRPSSPPRSIKLEQPRPTSTRRRRPTPETIDLTTPPPSPPMRPQTAPSSPSPSRSPKRESQATTAQSAPTTPSGKRQRSPQSSIRKSPNKSDKKKASTSSNNVFTGQENRLTYHLTDEAGGDDQTDAEYDREIELAEANSKVHKYYTKLINEYDGTARNQFYDFVREKFMSAVDERHGEGYFDDNAPKTRGYGDRSQEAINKYKKDMKGWLDGIFTVR